MNIKYGRFVLAGQLLSVNSALSLKSLSDTSDALLFCQLYADLKTQNLMRPSLGIPCMRKRCRS